MQHAAHDRCMEQHQEDVWSNTRKMKDFASGDVMLHKAQGLLFRESSKSVDFSSKFDSNWALQDHKAMTLCRSEFVVCNDHTVWF